MKITTDKNTTPPPISAITTTGDVKLDETNDGIFMTADDGCLTTMDSGSRGDVIGDIFRAKTAGRHNDWQTRDADEASFREFVKIEEEAEKKFELLDIDDNTSELSTTASSLSDDIDIDEYAGERKYSFSLFIEYDAYPHIDL